MTKQVVYNGENQDYSQIARPGVLVAGSKERPQEFNTNFMEGSPFGAYSGRDSVQGGKKKKS